MGARASKRPARRRAAAGGGPTSFVGRTADLAALGAAFDDGARLVTVLGPAGMGKTRLAREYVSRSVGSEGRPVDDHFCDLSDATDLDGVCAAVSRVLDVPLGGSEGAASRLGNALSASKRGLLVLDNFEQVVEHAVDTLGLWMRLAPRTRFLATSRERLRLPGERLFDLASLSLPEDGGDPRESEAFTLFVDRARTSRRTFRVNDASAAEIAAIVRELDGVPLAIELAAARARVLGTGQILEHLSRRFELLEDRTRAVRERQATLRGAIDWSWNLLEPWEKSAWAQCAAFRGGFGLEAARAILDLSDHADAPGVLDVVQALCDKSLLAVEVDDTGESRFGLLSSMRDYAWEKLAGSEALAPTLRRHEEHVVRTAIALVESVRGPDGIDAFARLARERENLLAVHQRALAARPIPAQRVAAALEAAMALEPVLWARGPVDAQVSLIDSVLEAAGDSPIEPVLRARALRSRAYAFLNSGRFDDALGDFAEATTLATGAADERLLAWIETGQAWSLMAVGRSAEAYELYLRARDHARGAGSRLHEGRAVLGLGELRTAERNLAEARELNEEALSILEEVGDLQGQGMALGCLASLHLEAGELVDAQEQSERALAIHRRLRDRRSELFIVATLGHVEQCRGRSDAARGLFEAALQTQREVGPTRVAGYLLSHLGWCHLDEGDEPAARRCLSEAMDAAREHGDAESLSSSLGHLGRLEAARGDFEASEAALREAESSAAGGADARVSAVMSSLSRGHLEVAEAARALGRGDEERAATARSTAADRLRAVREGEDTAAAARSFEVRLVQRSLESVLGEDVSGDDSEAASLLVGPRAEWFEAPGASRVDLARRRAVRRLLECLVEHRLESPGRALSTSELFAGGWPGEKVQTDSATARVYVALSTLRKLGLTEILLRRDDGYLLDPNLPLHRRN